MRKPWDGIEGIVLDAVGTLIDPDPPVAFVYATAARRQGVSLDEGEVKARFHRHFRNDEVDETLGPLATDEATERRRWRRIVANVLPELPDQGRAFQELWDHFASPFAWRCFPDVAPALEAFRRAGLPVRIASNFDARLRRVVAGLPGLRELDGGPIISSEVGFRKPHPAFFEAACANLGRRPGAVLCVGDDIDNDVLGANRAGLRGVWLDRQGRGGAGEFHRVPDLATLAALRED